MKDTLSKKEKWQTVVEDRFHKINLSLQKLKTGFGAEDVHDFRVEIKKLKALLRLFRSVAKAPSSCRFPKRLNKSYKYLGHLREWQIQYQKINAVCSERDFKKPVIYLDKINRKTEWYTKKAGQSLLRLSSLEKNKEWLKKHFSEIPSPTAIQTFIVSKMLALQELFLEKTQDDESMHFMRKLLKDVQYTISYAEKKRDNDGRSSSLKSIQAVTRKLGNFHDMRVALSLLDRELKVLHETEGEKKLLWEIWNQWQIHKEILRQEAWVKCRNLADSKPG